MKRDPHLVDLPVPEVNKIQNPEKSVRNGVLAVWTAAMAVGMAASEGPEPATSAARLLLVQRHVSHQLGLRSSLGRAPGGRRRRRHYRIPGTRPRHIF